MFDGNTTAQHAARRNIIRGNSHHVKLNVLNNFFGFFFYIFLVFSFVFFYVPKFVVFFFEKSKKKTAVITAHGQTHKHRQKKVQPSFEHIEMKHIEAKHACCFNGNNEDSIFQKKQNMYQRL